MIKTPTSIELAQAGYDEDTIDNITNKKAKFLQNAGHPKHEIENLLSVNKFGPEKYPFLNELTTPEQNKYWINPAQFKGKNSDETNALILENEKKIIKNDKEEQDLYAANAHKDYDKYTNALDADIHISSAVENNYNKIIEPFRQKDALPEYFRLNVKGFNKTNDFINFNVNNIHNDNRVDPKIAANNAWSFLQGLSMLTANGRMKYSEDGKRSGLWYLTDDMTIDYHANWVNFNRSVNPNWRQSKDMDAYMSHRDGTLGIPDTQGMLMAAWLFSLPQNIIKGILSGDTEAMKEAYKLWENYDPEKKAESDSIFDSILMDEPKDVAFIDSTARNANFFGKPTEGRQWLNEILSYLGGQGGYNNFYAGTDNSVPGKIGRIGLDKNKMGYEAASDYYKIINPERRNLDANHAESLYRALSHYVPNAWIYYQGGKLTAASGAQLGARLGVNFMGTSAAQKTMAGAGAFTLESALTQLLDAWIEEGLVDSPNIEEWEWGKMWDVTKKLVTSKEYHLEQAKATWLGLLMTKAMMVGKRFFSVKKKGDSMEWKLDPKSFKLVDDPKYKGEFVGNTFYTREQIKALLFETRKRYGMSGSYKTKDKYLPLYPELGITPETGEVLGAITGLSVGQSLIYGVPIEETFDDTAALLLSLYLFKKVKTNYNEKAYSQYSNYGIKIFTPGNKNNPFKHDFEYIIDGQAGPHLYTYEAAVEKVLTDNNVIKNRIFKTPIDAITTRGTQVVDSVETKKGDELTVTKDNDTGLHQTEDTSSVKVPTGFESWKMEDEIGQAIKKLLKEGRGTLAQLSTEETPPTRAEDSWIKNYLTSETSGRFPIKDNSPADMLFPNEDNPVRISFDREEGKILQPMDVKEQRKEEGHRFHVYTPKEAIEEFVRLQESNVTANLSKEGANALIRFHPDYYRKLAEYVKESGQEYFLTSNEEKRFRFEVEKLAEKAEKGEIDFSRLSFEERVKQIIVPGLAITGFDFSKKYSVEYVSTVYLPHIDTTAIVYRIQDELFMFPAGLIKYFTNKKNITKQEGDLPPRESKFDIYAVFERMEEGWTFDRELASDNEIVKIVIERNGQNIAHISPVQMNAAMQNMAVESEKEANKMTEPPPITLGPQGNMDNIDLTNTRNGENPVFNIFNENFSGLDMLDAMVLANMMYLDVVLKQQKAVRDKDGNWVVKKGQFYPGIKEKEISPEEWKIALDKVVIDFSFLEAFGKNENFKPLQIADALKTLFHELGHAQSRLAEFVTMPSTEWANLEKAYLTILQREIDRKNVEYGLPIEFTKEMLGDVRARLLSIKTLAAGSEYAQAYEAFTKLIFKNVSKKRRQQIENDIRLFLIEQATWKDQDLRNPDKKRIHLQRQLALEKYAFFKKGINASDKEIIDLLIKFTDLEPTGSNIFGHMLRRQNFIASVIDIRNGELKNKDEYSLEEVEKRILEEIDKEIDRYQSELDDLQIPSDLENLVEDLRGYGAFHELGAQSKKVFNDLDKRIQQSILIKALRKMPNVNIEQLEGNKEFANLIEGEFANHGVFILENIARDAFRLSLMARPISPLVIKDFGSNFLRVQIDYDKKAVSKLSPFDKVTYDPTNWSAEDWLEFISFTDADITRIENSSIVKPYVAVTFGGVAYYHPYRAEQKKEARVDVEKYYKGLTNAEKLVFLMNLEVLQAKAMIGGAKGRIAFGKGVPKKQRTQEHKEKLKYYKDLLDYRRSADEVWADAFSMLLIDPNTTQDVAPNLSALFLETMDRRPELRKFYQEYVFESKGYSKNRSIVGIKQWGELMRSGKNKVAALAQKLLKKHMLPNRLLHDSDYRALYLFSKLNSQYPQEYFLRHGAGRPGPIQAYGLWNAEKQKYDQLNLNEMALHKIDDAKFSRTWIDILFQYSEDMNVILKSEALRLGVPYEFFEAYSLAKGLYERNRIERSEVIPGYVLLEAGMKEEQIEAYKKIFGENYRSIETMIREFEAEPEFAVAREALEAMYGPKGKVVRWLKRYTSTQSIMKRETWNNLVKNGWYIALSNPDGMIKDFNKDVVPYGKTAMEAGRTEEGFENVSIHVHAYTNMKLIYFLEKHLENENMKAQFGIAPVDGKQVGQWIRENGEYDPELANEQAEVYEKQADGTVGVFVDRNKILLAQKNPKDKIPIAKDQILALDIGYGDVVPYLSYLAPIPGFTIPNLSGWRLLKKGEVHMNGWDELSPETIEILGKNMKRWHLAVKTGTEPMQREMGKRVKEAWQKAQTDINYKNQENFMNDIRLARIKEIKIEWVDFAEGIVGEEKPTEEQQQEYDQLKKSDRQKVVIRKDNQPDTWKYQRRESTAIYETSKDLAHLGLQVLEMKDYKQLEVVDPFTGIKYLTGEYDPSFTPVIYRVVVSDLFKFDTRVETSKSVLLSGAGKATGLYQAIQTSLNYAFIPINFVMDAGSKIAADNNAYQIFTPWKMKAGKPVTFAGVTFTPSVVFERQPTSYTIELWKAAKKATGLVFRPERNKWTEEAIFAEGLVLSIKDNHSWSGGLRENLEAEHLNYIKDIETLKDMSDVKWGESRYFTNAPDWVVNTANIIHNTLQKTGVTWFFGNAGKSNKTSELTVKEANYQLGIHADRTRLQVQQDVRRVVVDFLDTAPWARDAQIALPFHKITNSIMHNFYYHYDKEAMKGPEYRDWKRGRFLKAASANNLFILSMVYVLKELLDLFGFFGWSNQQAQNRISAYTSHAYINFPMSLKANKKTNALAVSGIKLPAPPPMVIMSTYIRTILFPLVEQAAIHKGLAKKGDFDYRNPGFPFFKDSKNKLGIMDLYNTLLPSDFQTSVLSMVLDIFIREQIGDHRNQNLIDERIIKAKRGEGIFSEAYKDYFFDKTAALADKYLPSFVPFNFTVKNGLLKEQNKLLQITGINRFLLDGEFDYSLAHKSSEFSRGRAHKGYKDADVIHKYISGNHLNKEDMNRLAIALMKAKKNKKFLTIIQRQLGSDYDRNLAIILKAKSKSEMIQLLLHYQQGLSGGAPNKRKEETKRQINKKYNDNTPSVLKQAR